MKIFYIFKKKNKIYSDIIKNLKFDKKINCYVGSTYLKFFDMECDVTIE